MPEGKPAAIRCIQLTQDGLCRIFGRSERPAVCRNLVPCHEMCGNNAEEALQQLKEWEQKTCPDKGA
jgi:hypothetical protein